MPPVIPEILPVPDGVPSPELAAKSVVEQTNPIAVPMPEQSVRSAPSNLLSNHETGIESTTPSGGVEALQERVAEIFGSSAGEPQS